MGLMDGRTGPALRVAFATLCIVASGLRFSTTAMPQQVTFKSGVDLVAVDTQVIDRDGQPIGDLAANNFEVWINGQPRKVVSADLIRYPLAAPRSLVAPPPVGTTGVVQRLDVPPVTGRVIVIAVDEMSFSFQAVPAVLKTVKRFLDTLSPDDVVAAYPYPYGNGRLDLTHFHNQVGLQLSHVQGMRPTVPAASGLFLSPSEAVDIASNDGNALESAYERECLIPQGRNGCVDRDSGERPAAGHACGNRLKGQANEYAGYMESLAADSFGGLRSLLQNLQALSGPKTVVLVSAGLTISDRVGGRPDVVGAMTAAGQLAAAADATVYVMHFDGSLFETYSAANGTANTFNSCQQSVSNAFTNQARDEQLNAFGLQRIAGQASGEYFRILAGNGDMFFNRVLKETAAYYVLGVQPEDADRDGRMHFLRVKTVDVKGATVRARAQVTIPKTGSGK